jgi:hypothetical protein
LLYSDILKFAGFISRTCGQSNPVVRQQRLIGATNISEVHLSRGDLEIVHYRMGRRYCVASATVTQKAKSGARAALKSQT